MIFDEITDVSYTLQMSFVLRFVLKGVVKEKVAFINFHEYALSSDDKIQHLNDNDNIIILLEPKITEIF